MKKCLTYVLLFFFLTGIMPGYALAAIPNVTLKKPSTDIEMIENTNDLINESTTQTNLPQLAKPDAPANLSAISRVGYIKLTWQDNSNSETGFVIERKEADGTTFGQIDYAGPNEEEYEDHGGMWAITSGVRYTYRIRAYNEAGESEYSNEASATALRAAPLPPYNLKVEKGVFHLHFFWELYDDDIGVSYELQRAKQGQPFVTVARGTRFSCSDNIRDLEREMEYSYRVKAVNQQGSSYSSVLKVYLNERPSPPESIGTSPAGGSKVKLFWTDTSYNEEGFYISYKKEGGAYIPYTSPSIIKADPNATEQIVTGLEPENLYYFLLSSYNATGGVSQPLEASCSTGPKAPSGLAAQYLNANRLKLTWVNNSSGIEQFDIERKTEGGTYTCIGTLDHTPVDMVFIDNNVEANTTYYYRVKAWDVWYPSDYSGELCVTVSSLSSQLNVPLRVPKSQVNINQPVNSGESTSDDSQGGN